MLADNPRLKKNPNATVTSVAELVSLDSSVTEIVIDNGVGESDFAELDFSRFSKLKSLEIGNNSFSLVDTLSITGLSELESVVIGRRSFTKKRGTGDSNPNRHFYLKDCPSLKSLKVDQISFCDYGVSEIENVDALEVIEIGYDDFTYTSLELKGILIHSE